ncbi:MAG: deoxyribodipyrimidine photo-lyase [Rhizobiales bacterium]|nr:deoxyribodipyrimidine photo-lyase [Hyphomicrobiales bacterium]
MANPAVPFLVIYSSDLRVADNPALHAAMTAAKDDGAPVVALYVLEEAFEAGTRPSTETARAPGGAGRWWLHHSLEALARALEDLHVPLVLRKGERTVIVKEIADEIGAGHLTWNRQYDAAGVAFGKAIKQWAKTGGRTAKSYNGGLLHDPYTLKTKSGGPFRVFSPFWKACLAAGDPVNVLPEPAALVKNPQVNEIHARCEMISERLADWRLLPEKPDWAKGFAKHLQPGEAGAKARLEDFLAERAQYYADGRDFPAGNNTSRLSAHLRYGEISPQQVWTATKNAAAAIGRKNADKFLAELGWREFSHHLLYHNPDLATANFNPKFDDLEWYDGADAETLLRAWQKGRTGYPIVDAGMRELWQTGIMHNRVRMVVGSFLVKHLLMDWRHGETWFWDTLVDACPANNTASWQWVAGCGADAAPYFRIFNPILQGEKFDADGTYVRQFVPELAKVPNNFIHKPWAAAVSDLEKWGVRLGETYPAPIVAHEFARERALAAFQNMKQE